MSKQTSTLEAETSAITILTVAGYKSIADETTIEIRPLTLLAGANSSGKSSMMQPFLLLKQTLEAPFDPGPLLLNGPNLAITSSETILTKGSNKRIYIGIETSSEKIISEFYWQDENPFIQLESTSFSSKEKTYRINRSMSIEQLKQLVVSSASDPDILRYLRSDRFSISVLQDRCFLNVTYNQIGRLYFDSVRHDIQDIIHVPGLRGNPKQVYPITPVTGVYQGTFENYVASIVHHWQRNKDPRLIQLAQQLQQLGLTNNLGARRMNDTQIELQVSRTWDNSDDLVSIADVGLGVSQVLPVLVGLLVARPGQMVYVEQPEIHLHPRAQVALGNVLEEAAQRDVRVVVETHSRLLLQSIQSLVAEQKLDPALVKMHWFQQGKDGRTVVNSTNLDEKGAFGNWPIDFDDIELQQHKRYMDAVEKLMWSVYA